MKIVSIFAAMPSYCGGLLAIKKIVGETFLELGVETDDINLAFNSLPYYDGMKSGLMGDIAERLRSSDGIIIYFSASLGLPGAMVQTFMEHLGYKGYDGLIRGKSCFLIGYGIGGQTADAAGVLTGALYKTGAVTGERIIADDYFCDNLKEGSHFTKLVERQTEDFYRLVRQKRLVYIPFTEGAAAAEGEKAVLPGETVADSEAYTYAGAGNAAEKDESRTLINANGEQKKIRLDDTELNEIAKLFEKKLNAKAEPAAEIISPLISGILPAQDKPSLKQNTAAVAHYYRPGQAEGLKAKIMLNIEGGDGFDGYLAIDGADCTFFEGTAENPDVTVIAGDTVWSDILKGKLSAQKAFMIGQIKVRGNFIILTKFDQMFGLKKS